MEEKNKCDVKYRHFKHFPNEIKLEELSETQLEVHSFGSRGLATVQR